MKLQEKQTIHGFAVDRSRYVPELHSQAYELHHIQSGARLLYIQNDDDNKVFSISFRTTPSDSTGVPHICEHSTLCGSRKFPLKEPFVELVKGSLNTFLNAMTFPDKTMYPVASRNAADFKNLMDVYLDAVFFPNMIKDKQVLMQEGWHYHLDSADSELTYRGVVYNEMKGVFSSPDSQMERHVMDALFPDTTYGIESGGNPDDIPSLTQEAFAAFHAKYYHPSNSYLFLYGDMDIDQTLAFIDGEYLSQFHVQSVDSAIGRQTCPGSQVKTYPYGIATGEKTDHKTLHSLTYVIDDALDPTVAMAFKVLTYVLLQSPAAPLKKALVDAGLGKDISGDFQDGILQPLWGISVNGSDSDKQAQILPLVRKVLSDMVRSGLDKTLLTGALNRTEFALREADFVGRPKGLIYGIRCMDTWLYDMDPLAALSYEGALETLRRGIDNGYFEGLIQKYILDNPYYALVSLVPEPGLTERHDKALADKLAAYKASLSKEEIDAIVADSQALQKRQATPDSPEALETIPTLTRDDLEKKVDSIAMEQQTMDGVTVCYVPDETNGITYVNAYFDLHGLTREERAHDPCAVSAHADNLMAACIHSGIQIVGIILAIGRCGEGKTRGSGAGNERRRAADGVLRLGAAAVGNARKPQAQRARAAHPFDHLRGAQAGNGERVGCGDDVARPVGGGGFHAHFLKLPVAVDRCGAVRRGGGAQQQRERQREEHQEGFQLHWERLLSPCLGVVNRIPHL